jgi:hypothetical protein
MKTRRIVYACVVALAWIGPAGRPARAFVITPDQPGANSYTPSQPYTLANGTQGLTVLNPRGVESLPRGGTAGFLAALTAGYGPNGTVNAGWTWSTAPADLQGGFNITTYQAQGDANFVGALFRADYNPGQGDPMRNFHWIQRVVADNRPAPGVIDVKPGQTSDPYYDTGFNPGSTYFTDNPARGASSPHWWSGEVYLVVETAPKTFTIYNGVRWGWVNTLPEPSALLLGALGLAGAAGCGAAARARRHGKGLGTAAGAPLPCPRP